MRPKILLSYKTKGQLYIDAVEKCGGDCTGGYLPRYDASADGLLLCGGSDIDPAIYGSCTGGSRDIDRARDDCELGLMKMALSDGKPVFGICRGCQLINVYFGGTLIEDLPSAKYHSSPDPKGISHTVMNEENSIMGKLYGKALMTNSFHLRRSTAPVTG